MKVLAIGCIHGDKQLVQRLAEKAEKEEVDLVLLAGDLTMFDQSTEGLVGPFVEKGKKVMLVPGNHETFATADFLAQLYGATNLHGYSIKHKNIGFFGCGGANVGPNMISENEIFETLKKGYEYIKHLPKKIMLTHVPPDTKKMELGVVPCSSAVKKAIELLKPDLVVCSHIHEAKGIEEKIGKTKVINVAKKEQIFEI